MRCDKVVAFSEVWQVLEAQKPTQSPEIPPKNRVRDFFRIVRANLPLCDASEQPKRKFSAKLFKMNFVI